MRWKGLDELSKKTLDILRKASGGHPDNPPPPALY